MSRRPDFYVGPSPQIDRSNLLVFVSPLARDRQPSLAVNHFLIRNHPGRDPLTLIELQRQVTTATPVGAHDRREGKEPRERFELTA